MAKTNWHIRNIDDDSVRLVRTHAVYRDIGLGDMLEVIIREWSEQNRLTIESSTPPAK